MSEPVKVANTEGIESTQEIWQGSGPAAYLVLYLKGMAMGLGDSVPGVSGGTIAVITRIYDTLIYSIRAVDLSAMKLIRQGQWQASWRHVNGTFLLLLGTGILSGLLLSARSVLFLLEHHFETLMAFFIGLVLASTWLLRSQFLWCRGLNLLALGLGVLITGSISFLAPYSGDLSLGYLFFSGALAICAMILPGLSGAFILLLLGAYEVVLRALVAWQWGTIMTFAAGCGIGLLAFSRLLAWLLKHYHEPCYGFISGLLLGSLLVLWPWQQTVSWYTDREGVLQPLQTVNVWPTDYAALTGNEPLLGVVLLAGMAGLGLVWGLQRLLGPVNRVDN